MTKYAILGVLTFTMLASTSGAIQDKDDIAKLEKQRCPKPAELAIIFSNGYAGDQMPKDDAKFDELLKIIKDGGFNVIHCTYTEKRLELCKKHGIRMMIDMLAEEHIFKNPDKAQTLCEKLRGNPDVWGYNIWNDQIGKTTAGRRRDINNVRRWDATHPAFCGTYRVTGMSGLTNADIFGYYDFHWKRGIDQHFPHLLAYSKWGRERDTWFYTWLSATSGIPGKGNFNRSLWSANTGLACGLKGYFWFLGGDLMNPKTLAWTEIGRDLTKVNLEIAPLGKEMAKLGMPTHLYSTPVTKTMNDKPVEAGKKDVMPRGLENHGFAKDFWLQPAEGEFVLGAFNDAAKRDFVFLANHNAYAPQQAALKLERERTVELFNRKKGAWQPLEVREKVLRLPLGPGGGELLRFGK